MSIGTSTVVAFGVAAVLGDRDRRRLAGPVITERVNALEPSIALVAAGSLGLAVVALGYGVVAIVGVIVGPGFLVLVTAEATAVVVWAAVVQQGVNRRLASRVRRDS